MPSLDFTLLTLALKTQVTPALQNLLVPRKQARSDLSLPKEAGGGCQAGVWPSEAAFFKHTLPKQARPVRSVIA
jgi:hypothetical protein